MATELMRFALEKTMDRELLKLAAKAAGITLKPMQINNVSEQGDDRFIGYMTDCEQWPRGWFDPLTDDGDALRLAVKLNIDLRFYPDSEITEPWVETAADGGNADEALSPDPYAATRRAIVRAAAEIGRAM